MAKKKESKRDNILTHASPSKVRSVADSLVIKDNNIFLVTAPSGRVPSSGQHGFGLFFNDCRWLDAYEIGICGNLPDTLMAADIGGSRSMIEMTNVGKKKGNTDLEKDSISLRSRRTVNGSSLTFSDELCLKNHARWPQELTLEIHLGTRFDDLFQVRGIFPGRPKRVSAEMQDSGHLIFQKVGSDNIRRILRVNLSRRPGNSEGGNLSFPLRLKSGEEWRLKLEISIHSTSVGPAKTGNVLELRASRSEQGEIGSWLEEAAKVSTDSLVVNQILGRSFSDLKSLRSTVLGEEFFSAGIPWFSTLFGRDSLITAIQILPFDQDCAADTLRVMAKLQADSDDDYRDASPGKILHELRVGELAASGQIPHTPYYGTIDATPLFLILLSRHSRWAGSLELFRELKGSVEAALNWIDRCAESGVHGFLGYESSRSVKRGLVNQGWKDGGNSILNERGRIPFPPIFLVEVQGYLVEAKRGMAELFRLSGEEKRASLLESQAEEIRTRLNRYFWSSGKKTFGLALEKEGRLLEVVTSNPGHLLWCSAADPDKAAGVAGSLMSESMFAGWGVRTLSSEERGYHPIGYHLGTVWPHDNGILAEGLRRYGFDKEALRIFRAITEAAMNYRDYRLPEVFAGFSKKESPKPVRYPSACSPQAWVSGSYPHLLATILGLKANSFENRLEIVRPLLPEFLERVEIHGLKLGNGELDLRFLRGSDGKVVVKRTGGKGDLEVRVVESWHSGPASAGPGYPAKKAG